MGFQTAPHGIGASEIQLAEQYLAMLEEGAAPELEEFLLRIPRALREGTFQVIDAALANREAAPVEDDFVLPKEEVVLTARPTKDRSPQATHLTIRARDRWIGRLCLLVPGAIRHQFLGEILATRAELTERSVSPLLVNLSTILEVLRGLAQRAPLSESSAKGAEQTCSVRQAAIAGWVAWRVSGTALLLSLILGVGPLLWLGILSLFVAFTSLAIVVGTARAPWGHRVTRLVNGVLAGTVLVLTMTILFGLFAGLLFGLSAIFSLPWLAGIAFGMLGFVSLLSLSLATAVGWAPEPWAPQRLVRI